MLFLSSCAGKPPTDAPLHLKQSSFSALPGWRHADHKGLKTAFEKSCARILKQNPDRPFGPDDIGGTHGDWQPICNALPGAQDMNVFFERWFTPYKAYAGTKDDGLFTGYYEASLRGSYKRHGPYQTPLHTRPDDLVMVDLGAFRESLRGQRIAGRVQSGKLKPYEDRSNISAGRWPHNDKILAWVDDPVDAFFLHIQGSGRIEMDDGSTLRAGYAGQNGHVYYAIGRELVKRKAMDKDKISMQSIRAWLEAHPHEAQDIMNKNASYVFFRALNDTGPEGGEGVTLTPLRSLAVDRSRIPYGVPLWLDIDEPVPQAAPLRRLMIAQDTGGAIRGAVRGDVYWGHGQHAENMAGQMKAQGQYWLLLPRTAPAP